MAEKAGVSVGSLYQYFPNKAAILFRLQSDEWRQTSDLLRSILEDARRPPLKRLRILVHAFLRSECEEAVDRDLNRCIALGGNIYFLAKIGATDGKSFQQMAGSMTGMTEEEYRDMMVSGGRSIEGKRYVGEDGDAQAHRQPQGAVGRRQES